MTVAIRGNVAVRGRVAFGPLFDSDAITYFNAITAAGSTIGAGNKNAVDAFVKGCKADGIWTAIKACCMLAGPDSLAGALVPLVGTAPTNNGPFVSGDYSRTLGLKGDGSKSITPNFSVTSGYQNNVHCAVWRTTAEGAGTEALFGNTAAADGLQALVTATSRGYRANDSSALAADTSRSTGLLGVARNSSTESKYRYGGTTQTRTVTSKATITTGMTIYGRAGANLTISGMSFYSIGEYLDLDLLDSRLATYMAALT